MKYNERTGTGVSAVGDVCMAELCQVLIVLSHPQLEEPQ